MTFCDDERECPAAYACRGCGTEVCVPCDIAQPDCAHARDLCAECRMQCAECRDDAAGGGLPWVS